LILFVSCQKEHPACNTSYYITPGVYVTFGDVPQTRGEHGEIGWLNENQ